MVLQWKVSAACVLLLTVNLCHLSLTWGFNTHPHPMKVHVRRRRSQEGKQMRHRLAKLESGLQDKPKWAAGGVVSDAVNLLIASPLFGLMKIAARNTLISTAEKNGIPWVERAKAYKEEEHILEDMKGNMENKEMKYPKYYTREFHAYDEGNLNWIAAAECESATMSMALRVWPKDELSAQEAQDRLRASYLDSIAAFASEMEVSSLSEMIDVGCSVGVSTFYMAERFPAAKTIDGLDLSPHFLSVAKYRQEREPSANIQKINWMHANIENSGIPDNSYDVTAASFVFHELPAAPTDKILKELYRITRCGGVVAITDNNPMSPVIQGLPPALFALMKSTEPWSDEYYIYDFEGSLRKAGFECVRTEATDPRHRTILAYKSKN